MLFKHKGRVKRVMDTIKVEDNYQPLLSTSFEKHALVAWVCCNSWPNGGY
jgi:hypothetical protein